MKSMRDLLHGLVAALSVTVLVLVSGCSESGATEEPMGVGGLVFERMEIANVSGDVKLVGDIDGDGNPDLVLGGFPSDKLSWWHWPDLRATTIAVPRNEITTDGELADLDGDGDLDIVAGDGSDGNNLVWFENPRPSGDPATEGSWKRHEIGIVGNWVKDVEIADFDGDGRMDIATRSPSTAMIFFQDKAGWQRVLFRDIPLGEEGMTSGDVDADGDVDLVLCGDWASNPGGVAARKQDNWNRYKIGPFNSAFKAVVVDVDQDGHADVLTSSSEHTEDVAWYRADNGPTKPWSRHVIQPFVQGAHTLQAGDMDGDGDIDVVVGQMHTTRERELAIHFNVDGRGNTWQRQVIDNVGLHNGLVADIDLDGDLDIYGANWVGNPPLRVWLNRLDPPSPPRHIDRWTARAITNAHVRSFGLTFADMDRDGRTDIVSGPFWYRQPEDTWGAAWRQIRLGKELDAVAAPDVDADGGSDVIAQRTVGDALRLVWLKPKDPAGTSFEEHIIGETPAASHKLGSQGHAFVRLAPGQRPVLAASSGGGVFYFKVPEDPDAGPWPRVRICAAASDEGIVFADIDHDGFSDLVATTGEAKGVAWWRNPGDGSADWERHDVGTFPDAVYPDRVAVADLDGDKRLDIIATEENGEATGAEAYWWRQPESLGKDGWEAHQLASRGSLNSLSAADLDGDGDVDIVMAEHRGARRISIWNNLGGGRFAEQLVGAGIESHLGAQTVDLDGDGDLDIVSIAWDAPGTIHAWRNDAVAGPTLPASVQGTQ